MNYKIERGLKMPEKLQTQQYPFGDLKIGDCFRISVAEKTRVQSAASQYARRHSITLSVLKTNDPQIYRVWRRK